MSPGRRTVVVSVALVLASCRAAPSSGSGCAATGARIVLEADGRVSLNGKTMAVASLAEALRTLTPAPTEICYAREGADDSVAHIKDVIDIIAGTRLPVGIFTDDSFTTPVSARR